jgi:outer membrane protein
MKKSPWAAAAVGAILATGLVSGLTAGTPAQAGGLWQGMHDGRAPIWVGGAVLAISPRYEGSDEYRVTGIPYIFPSFGSASKFIQIRGPDDVRFRLLRSDRFEAGPLAGYKFDRDEDDGPRLAGLGDVDGGLVVGGYARLALLPALFAGLSYHRTVTGDVDGGQLKLGLEYKGKAAHNVSFTAGVGTTYADEEYMQAYFGVTAAQAARSRAGLAAFDADAGFKDVYVSLGTKVTLSPRWSFSVNGRYAHLIGDAADSPVIETESQFSGSAGFTYRFGNGGAAE